MHKCAFLQCCNKIQHFQHRHKFCIRDLKNISWQTSCLLLIWVTDTQSFFSFKTTFQIHGCQTKQLCQFCTCLMEQQMIVWWYCFSNLNCLRIQSARPTWSKFNLCNCQKLQSNFFGFLWENWTKKTELQTSSNLSVCLLKCTLRSNSTHTRIWKIL